MDNIEGHPIPQDFTSFQFKLIGDITLKQFAYLGGGAVLAWSIISLPILGIIKIPLGFLILLIAIVLVFISIKGRSADTMLGLFLKALVKPNAYKYLLNTKVKEQNRDMDLNKKNIVSDSVISEPVIVASITNISSSSSIVSASSLNTASGEDNNINEIKKEEENVNSEIEKNKKELEEKIKEEKSENVLSTQESHQKALALEKMLHQMEMEKEELERRLIKMEEKLKSKNDKVYTISDTQNVKAIPEDLQKTSGMPFINDIPNLVSGVIKNPKGEFLPNILIEIKDSKGNPARAFKTNKLGQFASSTPLINGSYKVIFEDPSKKNNFDKIQIDAIGQVISPLEVTSLDEREKLRKQLFG